MELVYFWSDSIDLLRGHEHMRGSRVGAGVESRERLTVLRCAALRLLKASAKPLALAHLACGSTGANTWHEKRGPIA